MHSSSLTAVMLQKKSATSQEVHDVTYIETRPGSEGSSERTLSTRFNRDGSQGGKKFGILTFFFGVLGSLWPSLLVVVLPPLHAHEEHVLPCDVCFGTDTLHTNAEDAQPNDFRKPIEPLHNHILLSQMEPSIHVGDYPTDDVLGNPGFDDAGEIEYVASGHLPGVVLAIAAYALKLTVNLCQCASLL